jgi:enterochelin esterase-like enzyme
MRRLCMSLLAFCLAVTASAQFGWGPQSKIVIDSIESKVLNAYRAYSVFLPKSFETNPEKKYPILYLLHGVMDTNMGWVERGHVKDVMDQLVASGEACEMIIVTPNAGGNVYAGDWNGYFDMPGWSYETFFYTEFLPYIEKTYRAIGDKAHRAIAGLSMGGGGATSYGLRHPDMFSSVYAMSALMTIPNVGAVPSKNPGDKMEILNKSVVENSCIKYVENADEATKEQLRTVVWFVDCGDDDFLLDRNIEFTQAMRKANIPFQFRVRDGGHTWEYWHSALYTCLPFVTRNFNK